MVVNGYCNETSPGHWLWVSTSPTSTNETICDCNEFFHEDTKFATAISGIRITTSTISIIGSASIILMVLLSGRLNTAEVHPLFILSVADFILSILWMIGGIVWLSPGDHGWANEGSDTHTGMCYILGIATTMAEMVTFFLTTVYALNAFLRIREAYLNHGRRSDNNDKKKVVRHIITIAVYIISWVLPMIIILPAAESVAGIDRTDEGCWCVVDFYNLRPDNGLPNDEDHHTPFNEFAVLQASIMGASFTLAATMIIVLYVVTFYYAIRVIKMQRQPVEDKGTKMIKVILLRLTLFVTIFLITGLPSIAAAIAILREEERLELDEKPDQAVLFIHAFLSPLQGFLNAIVYGWSRKEFRRALNLEKRLTFSRTRRERTEQRGHYHSLNSAQNTHGPTFTEGSIALSDGSLHAS